MPSLTVKNIPDNVYKKLKKRAERHKRSLNSEILKCLETSVETINTNVKELIKKTQTLRETINYKISEEEINSLKQSGRL